MIARVDEMMMSLDLKIMVAISPVGVTRTGAGRACMI